MQAVRLDPAFTSPPATRALRLFQLRLHDPWALTAEQRQVLIDFVLGIIAHSNNDTDRIAAVRLILEMDRINLEKRRLEGGYAEVK